MDRESQAPQQTSLDVLIPARLLKEMGDAFSTFQLRVHREAALRALERHDSRPAYMTREDVLDALRVVLSTAPLEFDRALSADRPFHVRNAS